MKDPENGFFVEYGDIKGLKEKILEVLNNPKLAKKMSNNNFNKAKKFSWDIITKRYMKEYEELLTIMQ